MIEIILGTSVLINIFFVWYVVKLLKKFLYVSEELESVFITLDEFSDHIDVVYNMERFFGDATLEHLMRHSRDMSTQAKYFRSLYDINYENDEELEEFEEYEE